MPSNRRPSNDETINVKMLQLLLIVNLVEFLTNRSRNTPHKIVPKEKFVLPDNFNVQRTVGIIDNTMSAEYIIFLLNQVCLPVLCSNNPVRSITIAVVATVLVWKTIGNSDLKKLNVLNLTAKIPQLNMETLRE